MSETILCNYCHSSVDPSEAEAYKDPGGKVRIFHRGKCHDEARKDSHKFGIDDFKSVYGKEDRNEFK